MKSEPPRARLQREFRRLFRCMDSLASHPALKRCGRSRETAWISEFYQLLGLAWEFLSLQCRHWDGFRRTRDGKRACRICGKIAGADERWILLPRCGTKSVGRRITPNSTETFPNKRAALLLDDAIRFHGANLRVEVQNAYRSRMFRSHDTSIAADRMVTLQEGGVTCDFDTWMVRLEFGKRKRGAEPPAGAFVWELPRRALKKFPVMLEYDRRGRFVGLCIFRPDRKAGARAVRREKR